MTLQEAKIDAFDSWIKKHAEYPHIVSTWKNIKIELDNRASNKHNPMIPCKGCGESEILCLCDSCKIMIDNSNFM